ncbi:unnamed protein product [Diamesa tonsa]
MDVKSSVNWTNEHCIRSEFTKIEDLDITWRLMFYPKDTIIEDSEDYCKFTSKIKIVIEDKTKGKVQYKFRFKCDGDYTVDWNTHYQDMEGIIMYGKNMTQQTKYIETSHIVSEEDYPWSDITHFKIKVEVSVKLEKKIPLSMNSSAESYIIWPTENDNEQFETSSMINQEITTTSVRSPAFMASISKIISKSKNDSLPDLVILASKLLKIAKEFNLPDLKKISSGFLDFQISKDNFADILEMAVDQKTNALLNSATEFITINQKALRKTDQWDKMKSCPVMLLIVLEKLFEKTL